MTTTPPNIDIDDTPELRELTDRARREVRQRILSTRGEAVTLIHSVPDGEEAAAIERDRHEDLEAILCLAGSWAGTDFDSDEFIEQIYEDRLRGTKPPIVF